MLLLALLQVVALEGGTVHSMVPGEAPRRATVLIEGERIVAVGEDLEVPEDARRIDLSGKHLVPGLIDGMVHHDLEQDPLYLLAGVTLARDMGNDLGRIFIAAAPAARDAMPGPELWISGAIFDGSPPATTEAVVVTTPEEVENKLPRLIEREIDFATFHLGIPVDAWRRLIELSHESGLQVWGPVPRGAELAEVLAAGQDGICYLEGIAGEGALASAEELAAAVEAVANSGAAVTPLLRVYAYRIEDPGEDPPMLNYLAPYYVDWWKHDRQQRLEALGDEAYLARGREALVRLQGVVRDLWRAGVPLVPGSAAPNPWLMPGEGLHDELALWVDAGIPPAEVLRLATAGAATALGCAADRGTIQAGRIADLVVVAGDPTEDLSLLREPEQFGVRGRWFDAELVGVLRKALFDAQAELHRVAALPIEILPPELPEGAVVLQGRVESVAFDRVIAAEEYWVVRCTDGDTAWCARLVAPGGIGFPSSQQTQIQRFRDDKLYRFELNVLSGNSLEYRVECAQVGGQFRIKRWLGEQYLDTNSTPGRPVLVDIGLSLPGMILAHYRKDGLMPILYFEDLDPVLASWELQRGDNDVYAVKTPIGPMVLTVFEGGGLNKLARAEGKSGARYQSLRTTTFGGPGLIPRAAREAARSGEKKTGPPEEEGGGR